MILLDTHVWVWWVHGDTRLAAGRREALDTRADGDIAISAISCWEVAKLVEYGRLLLPHDLMDWISLALSYPGLRVLELSPIIAVESTRLPQPFHRDPADQLIVATARVHACELLTADTKILRYPHARTTDAQS